MLNTLAIKTLSGIKAIKDQIAKLEDGASSVEWVLIVAGIAGVIGLIIAAFNLWWTGTESSRVFK